MLAEATSRQPSGKQASIRKDERNQYKILYTYKSRRYVTRGFTTLEGGAAQIRRLNAEGKILGETVWLLQELRALKLPSVESLGTVH